MTLNDIFTKEGMFIETYYDPYRLKEKYLTIHNFLFDESGALEDCHYMEFTLQKFIEENSCSWASDIVKLYWAQQMGMNTKGSYPAIYMWR